MAVRSAAWDAGTVPARTWKNRKALVGTDTALEAPSAASMADTLVSVANVAGSVVATTCTFHHSGSPPLRVPTTWSWAGMGTLYRLSGDGLPGSAPAMADRSMVGGWSTQVAVAVHWVGGAPANSGTGMYSVSPWVVLPIDVPSGDGAVGSAEDGPLPTSQPVAAWDGTAVSQ